MGTKTRQDAREALAALLDAAKSSSDVKSVYNYFKGHLKGESPVVMVTSGSMTRTRAGQGTKKYEVLTGLNVIIAVQDANQSSGGLSEKEADDLIDAIEGWIADVVSDNQSGTAWDLLHYKGNPSEPLPGKDLDGNPYIIEIIQLEAMAYDE